MISRLTLILNVDHIYWRNWKDYDAVPVAGGNSKMIMATLLLVRLGIRVSSIGSLTNPEKWKPQGKMRTFYEGHFFQYGKSEISFFRSKKVALPLLSWSVWLLSTGNRCHQATPVAIGVVVLIPCFGGRSSKVMSGLSGRSTIWTIWHDLMICNIYDLI